MSPEHATSFGGGASETTLNPIVFVALMIAIILVFVLPRKYAVVPVLALAIIVPLGQSVVIGGAHFFIARLLVLAGLIRVLSGIGARESYFAGGYNQIDRAFFAYNVCQAVAVMILFREMPALVNQVGGLIDTAGFYFVLRALVRDEQDIYRVVKCFVIVAAIAAIGMFIEQIKHVNVFSFIGGVNAVPDVRDGKIRSQGPFSHTLLAGTFGATLLPLCVLLGKGRRGKLVAVIGAIAASVMVITSNSSSPLLAYIGGVVAICFWPLRRKMLALRWGLVAVLAGLAVAMKAPVWFIIAHIDLTGSSSGYHRAEVIDQFVRHFTDWYLIGVKETGSWGWDMWDTQNQYVDIGQSGGLAAFVFFITMLTRCFAKLGDSRKALAGESRQEWLTWLLGAALFAHVVGFFGVNYFDQSRFGFFGLLAMISVATGHVVKLSEKESGKPEAASERDDWAYSVLQSEGVDDNENTKRARLLGII